MHYIFCRRCGTKLTALTPNAYRCVEGHYEFNNPAPTAGVFFVDDAGNVLLAERGIEPRRGMLDSFGGFVDVDETFEEATIRELREELGLEPGEYEPLQYLVDAKGTYPFDGEDRSIIGIFFWSRLRTDRTLVPADDVASIVSLPLHDFDLELLHSDDVRQAICELRRKLA